jgi:hypothetical protein
VIEKTNSTFYSDTRKIWAGSYNYDFTIYPNPATDKLIISVKDVTGLLLKIMDISGKIILQQKILNNTTEITLSRLSPGTYLVQYNGMARKLVIR